MKHLSSKRNPMFNNNYISVGNPSFNTAWVTRNRLSFGTAGTHETEILQSPSTKDEAETVGGYSGAQHVRQEVTQQQPATKSTEAPTTTPKSSASYEDSAYRTKPDTTSCCPKDLRMEAERQMTEYEEDKTLLPSGTVNLTKASMTKFRKRPLCLTYNAPIASTLRRGRTEGSKRRGQSEDVVKGRRLKDENGDFQHLDSSIRRQLTRC